MDTNMTPISTDDEDRRVEREARHAIAADRATTAATHAWASREDAHLAAGYMVGALHALATLREYLLDVRGGVDGTADYLAVLCGLAADAGSEHCACSGPCDAARDGASPVDALAA